MFKEVLVTRGEVAVKISQALTGSFRVEIALPGRGKFRQPETILLDEFDWDMPGDFRLLAECFHECADELMSQVADDAKVTTLPPSDDEQEED
jgi:hypothetical protein